MLTSVSIRSLITLAALALLLAVTSACGDGDASEGDGGATAPVPTATVVVHFAGASGELVAEEREVPADVPAARAALDALASGPADPDLIPALPTGTRILGVEVADEVVRVDLSAEFESGYPPGGAAAEQAVLGPLVRTATAAAGVPAALITVDGRVPQPVGTQFDLSLPLTPGDVGL
ncbi:MAG: GerMN domain-containing protein [Miltoncostaeaceae bacterium]